LPEEAKLQNEVRVLFCDRVLGFGTIEMTACEGSEAAKRSRSRLLNEMTVKIRHFVTEMLAEPASGVPSLSVAVTVMV
jgi:hypothetical protein